MSWTCYPDRIRIYINSKRQTAAQIKADTGCDAIINGGLYDMGTFLPLCHLKANGAVLASDEYTYVGFGWNEGPDIVPMTDYGSVQNYICCVCLVLGGARQELIYDSAMGGARARSAIGRLADGRVWLYCSKAPATPEQLQEIAIKENVLDAIMLDGGGSTQCITPAGIVSSARRVQNYICIWEAAAQAEPADGKTVLSVAEDEVGYLEKVSASALDDPTENSGHGNYTKYARDMDALAGWYNGPKQGFDWCAVFVDWCFVQAYGRERAAELTYHTRLSAGCKFAMDAYRAAGALYSEPKEGDQIFFSAGLGTVAHTGIVLKVSDSRVWTIEGNTSGLGTVVTNGGCVRCKSYSKSFAKIAGYGRPCYTTEERSAFTRKEKGGDLVSVNVPILRQGDKGNEVRALQILLKGYGYDPSGIDGSFGPGCASAVKRFQAANGLAADGSVGPATWSKLLGG